MPICWNFCWYFLFFALLFGAGVQIGLHCHEAILNEPDFQILHHINQPKNKIATNQVQKVDSSQEKEVPVLKGFEKTYEKVSEEITSLKKEIDLLNLLSKAENYRAKLLKHAQLVMPSSTSNEKGNGEKLNEKNIINPPGLSADKNDLVVKMDKSNEYDDKIRIREAPKQLEVSKREPVFPNINEQEKSENIVRSMKEIEMSHWEKIKTNTHQSKIADFLQSGQQIPIILLTSKRTDVLKTTLNSLLAVKKISREQITVLQDGTYQGTANIVQQMNIRLVQNKNPKNLRGDGAKLIASHYKYSLGWAFDNFQSAPAIIIVEDDFFFSPDFLIYFELNSPILDVDPKTFVLSAWNDNGFKGKVHNKRGLHRTSYFPGLGWLLPRALWEELKPKWPDAHWDHFLRDPQQHKFRECIYPEVPRTFHNGVTGTFMDVDTHNRYFRDIDYNRDTSFSWNSGSEPIPPPYIQAIDEVYEAQLTLRIENAHQLHNFEELFLVKSGDIVIWYQLAGKTDDNPQPFKPIGQLFGIWHEEERGNHNDLHQFDWNTYHVFLINKISSKYSSMFQSQSHVFTADALVAGKRVVDSIPADTVAALANLKSFSASKTHQTCNEVCAAQGLHCSRELFPFLNTCEQLQSVFNCKKCVVSFGPEQPAYVDISAPESQLPGHCLTSSNVKESNCEASHKSTIRLCPCVE